MVDEQTPDQTSGKLPVTCPANLLLSACIRLQLLSDRGRLCSLLSKTFGGGRTEVVHRLSKVGTPTPLCDIIQVSESRGHGEASSLTESSGSKAAKQTTKQPGDLPQRGIIGLSGV